MIDIGKKMPKIMWLLNHSSARKFEISMLKQLGFNEIFLPKIIPADPSFRSASIDYSLDADLNIPAEDLAILNAQNWYEKPSKKAWEIANKHFDILFFILHHSEFMQNITSHWHGLALWRVYGLDKSLTYTKLSKYFNQENYAKKTLQNLYFAQAYDHLHIQEDKYLQDIKIDLPLGMTNIDINDKWNGINKKILFVCPDIGFNTYYKNIYEEFRNNFNEFDYLIGGSQPLYVKDKNILGYVTLEQHEKNMQECAVMFYHSTEPNHIHYHPFEAIKAGMPLIFMADGMLDKFGGIDLVGRCTSIKEAKQKITQIINNDKEFIRQIKSSQEILLQAMNFDTHLPIWQQTFKHLLQNNEKNKQKQQLQNQHNAVLKIKKRIAVILPMEYKGGSLRGAKLFAQAIYLGAQQNNDDVEIIFAHIDNHNIYNDEDFNDLPIGIKVRPYVLKIIDKQSAIRAMSYAHLEASKIKENMYTVFDDGINQFMDCDLWIVISDRVLRAILPIKPYLMMVYDYIQRYEPILNENLNQRFLANSRNAQAILVTTEFTRQNALQFAGLREDKVIKVPMLTPNFQCNKRYNNQPNTKTYFIWTTNLSPHKNHLNIIKALKIYYEEYQGTLDCYITGVNTYKLLDKSTAHLNNTQIIIKNSDILKNKLHIKGELSEFEYQQTLFNSCFLLHGAKIDNGTFSVIEAAQLGIPSLSTYYPAMLEINQQFNLNLMFIDAHSSQDIAKKLKFMEVNYLHLKKNLHNFTLTGQTIEELSIAYWNIVEEYI